MGTSNESGSAPRITRAEIESKLRNVQNLVQNRLQEEKPTIVGAAVGTGLIAVLVAYFAGKRRGRKQTAYVEIRRG